MRSDIALYVDIGSTVYNCFMDQFIVIQKTNQDMIVEDINGDTHRYNIEDLYLNHLEDEDDIEKSWVDWAKNNKDFILTFGHISSLKEIYKTAFAHGFEYKKRYQYEEMMQK